MSLVKKSEVLRLININLLRVNDSEGMKAAAIERKKRFANIKII